MKNLNIHLSEGKKQALQIKGATPKMVDEIAKFDPTSTNKFTYILTKLTVMGNPVHLDTEFSDLIITALDKGYSDDIDQFKTFYDLEQSLKAVAYKVTRGEMKKGLAGIKEGRDYLIAYKTDTWMAFMPLNYEASNVIASHRVGREEASWCISGNDGKHYWNRYIVDNLFIMLVNFSGNPDLTWYKFALQIPRSDQGGSGVEVYDVNDIVCNTSVLLNHVSGMTEALLEELYVFAFDHEDSIETTYPDWFKKAETEAASINIDGLEDHIFVWEDGVWKKGLWQGDIWENGTWENGTWENGTWEDGTWEFGTWEDGTWEDGIWEDGVWKDGTWERGRWYAGTYEVGEWKGGVWFSGTWENGVWEFGTWENGTWEGGTWENGIWERGTWENGVWEFGTWEFGTWEDGKWKKGTWENGTWEKGLWKDGIWKFGIWEDGTWEGGTWEDGTWKDGTWKNGTWEDGTWYNGTWESGEWEFGNWYNGTWEKGTWQGGAWHNGTWQDGTWVSGEWEFGTWKGGTWEEGIIFCKKYIGKTPRVTINPSKFYELEEKSESWDEFLEILESNNYLKGDTE